MLQSSFWVNSHFSACDYIHVAREAAAVLCVCVCAKLRDRHLRTSCMSNPDAAMAGGTASQIRLERNIVVPGPILGHH